MNKDIIAIKLADIPLNMELYQPDRSPGQQRAPIERKGFLNIYNHSSSWTSLEDPHFLIVGSNLQINEQFMSSLRLILSQAPDTATVTFFFTDSDTSPTPLCNGSTGYILTPDCSTLPSLISDIQSQERPVIQNSVANLERLALMDSSSYSASMDSGSYSRQSTERKKKDSPPMSGFSMALWGGFIAVLGIAAIAVAFTVLNAATLGIAGLVVAGIGAVATITGLGFFTAGCMKSNSEKQDRNSFDDLIVLN